MLETASQAPILQVDNLTTSFFTDDGVFDAVRSLSFHLTPGETLGIVGKSGCGKSVTALSIMGLLPKSNAQIVAGKIYFSGTNLCTLPEPAMRAIRGDRIAMVFQEPMTSLNPVLTIGRQIAESIYLNRACSWRDALGHAREMLELVRIPDPARRMDEYPHQMSGGMRQRVMIAIALSCEPDVLIADEPTTALDVTIQAQLLQLMRDLKERLGTTIMLITHDLGVVAEMCDRVIVMYGGRKVEEAPAEAFFADPVHPYSRGLLAVAPRLDVARITSRLPEIPGNVPTLQDLNSGCPFAPRCASAVTLCRREVPAIESVGASHLVACWETANRRVPA